MKRPDDELAGKIVRILDYSADHLNPQVSERLFAARRIALTRYREQPAPASGLAWAGHAIARFVGDHPNARYMVAGMALIAALLGIVYWQNSSPANDLAEIDAGLLTDDLPINAYLDKGFDSWLKRSLR